MRVLVAVMSDLRFLSPLGALAARPIADRRLCPRVLGVSVGRLGRFPALRGERLGRGRGGDEALLAAADEIAPAGVDQRLVHDEPVARLEELHERALRLTVAKLLDGLDRRHRQRVDAGVIDARGDVHRRRDEVLHLPRPVAVLLEKYGQLDHVFHTRAGMAGDEVGHEVLLLARPLARWNLPAKVSNSWWLGFFISASTRSDWCSGATLRWPPT